MSPPTPELVHFDFVILIAILTNMIVIESDSLTYSPTKLINITIDYSTLLWPLNFTFNNTKLENANVIQVKDALHINNHQWKPLDSFIILHIIMILPILRKSISIRNYPRTINSRPTITSNTQQQTENNITKYYMIN